MKIVYLLFVFVLVLPGPSQARSEYKIVTASERGTYIQIGQDLSKIVAQAADIGLEVLPSQGSAENVRRLRFEPGVKLALVQSDVYQAYLDQAEAGHSTASRLINPLRVVMPLYNEEIYFVARADSPLQSIHEIRDKKINIGPIGSGTALTATTLYKMMFNKPIQEKNASYLSNEDALLALATDKSIDVAIIVAGQPAKIFSEMKPEARQFIKLLSLNEKAPESALATKTYFPAVIRNKSYPQWLDQDTPTLTVKALLVTYDYSKPETRASLTSFTGALCANFAQLQEKGHPKWKEVTLDTPPLGKGWRYYPPAEQALRACRQAEKIKLRSINQSTGKQCSQHERVLGFCGM